MIGWNPRYTNFKRYTEAQMDAEASRADTAYQLAREGGCCEPTPQPDPWLEVARLNTTLDILENTLDQEADAEIIGDGPVPNDAMRFLTLLRRLRSGKLTP